MNPVSSVNKILDVVQNSGLHFVINRTPFSAYITIRQKFISNHGSQMLESYSEDVIKLKIENETLQKQVTEVSVKLEESEAKCDLAHDTIEILESKVKNAESKVLEFMKNSKSALDDKNEEIKVLNSVIKNTVMKF